MRKMIFIFLVLTGNLYGQIGNWTEQVSGINSQLVSVSSTSSSNCAWTCGNGIVLRTTNTGINWQNVSPSALPVGGQLVNIFGISSSIALAAGNKGTLSFIIRTTNGEINCSIVLSQGGTIFNAIWMTSNLNGFMEGNPVGGRWALWKTTDGGANWDSTGLYLSTAITETGYNNSLFCNGTNIWFGTNNSKIFMSSNSGLNWTARLISATTGIYALCFSWPGYTEGYAGGNSLYATTNSGLNWNFTTSIGTGNFGGITSTNLPVENPLLGYPIWYVRSDNKIYASTVMGNWNIDFTAPSGIYKHISQAMPGRGIWAVRDNGGISFHTIIAGIEKISSDIPENFELFQNYPNPFNPTTKIKFEIPSDVKREMSDLKLVVYDILGKEITTLVNEQLQPGTYEVTFDGSNYPSGIYFYKLIAGNFIETKKMLLIK